MAHLVLVGATGDVGRGILAALLSEDHQLTTVARDVTRLQALSTELGTPANMSVVQGDLATPQSAAALATACSNNGAISGVVISTSVAVDRRPVAELDAKTIQDVHAGNAILHLHAFQAFAPLLAEGDCFLGIGGGMADVVIPGFAAMSMAQAAQRMLYRHLARDRAWAHLEIRELLVVSMVNGVSTRSIAEEDWLSDADIGAHVAAILARPEEFAGPILNLSSRAQVGQADSAS